jgi:hypothetical protein
MSTTSRHAERRENIPLRATIFHAVGLKAMEAAEINRDCCEKSIYEKREDMSHAVPEKLEKVWPRQHSDTSQVPPVMARVRSHHVLCDHS